MHLSAIIIRPVSTIEVKLPPILASDYGLDPQIILVWKSTTSSSISQQAQP
jgi:hypothetical protein